MGQPSVLLAGGGSGGHLFPGIALGNALRQQRNATVRFACSDRPVDAKILNSSGFEFACLSSVPSTVLWKNPFRLLQGLKRTHHQAGKLLELWKPDVIIGLGGFASFPVVAAARRKKIPVVLLEQNLIPGRATRWLSRKATLVCTSFEETRSLLPSRATVRLTGNPVREAFQFAASKSMSSAPSGNRKLLILGGSQGAIVLNNLVLHALQGLKEELWNWDIIHQTGERHLRAVESAYRELGLSAEIGAFFPDLPDRLQQTDLVITRAGATTLAELACMGCPTILIPDPHALRNHQWHNARFYEYHRAARLVEQREGSAEAIQQLQSVLRELLSKESFLEEMQHQMRSLACPDAVHRVLDELSPFLG